MQRRLRSAPVLARGLTKAAAAVDRQAEGFTETGVTQVADLAVQLSGGAVGPGQPVLSPGRAAGPSSYNNEGKVKRGILW